MQNKGAIRLFTILLTLACIYYLVFTYVSNNVEQNAKLSATEYISSPAAIDAAKKYANGDIGLEKSYLDSMFIRKQDLYLDSIKKEKVYSVFITDFTYEDCKDQSINMGLDLRGGMNVTLEISIPELIRNMSNNNNDANFNKSIDDAQKEFVSSTKDFVTLFDEAYKRNNPNGRLAAQFQTIELKGTINYNTSDEEVLNIIRQRVEEGIATAEQTLRARIDKFGVVQPNIQKLQTSGRILIELPGVTDKERVRKLLQGTANLEFWETYENKEVYPLLADVNKRLSEIMGGSATDSTATDSTATAAKDSTNKTVAVVDSTKKDSTALGNLSQQLGKDTGKAATAAAAANDTSFAKFQKENPLFAVLRPAIYQDQQGQYNYSPGPVVGSATTRDTAKVNDYLTHKKVRGLLPKNMKFFWSFKPIDEKGTVVQLVAIKVTNRDGKSPLSGDIITDARKVYDQQSGGHPQISMSMSGEASQTWRRLTKDNIGKSIAIVLDNSVYSFPTVQGEISGGTSSITGNFDNKEADDLVNILRAGKFPAPCRIVEETVVGPTLGEESIKAGMFSFLIALLLVLLFMGFYYNKAGWIADIALLFNVFFVMGILASLGAVLTLPGIAGIVLTIGLSVDANILIFERVREELAMGKGVGLAVKEGFRNAMSSIIDSNVTTLLLGIILYVFGTGPIQGFATTLIIGILTSLFCAIFVSRLIFEMLLDRNKDIAFYTNFSKNAFKNINIDFVGKRKLYYLFSGAIIVLGIVFYFQKGFNLGVDFKGGRTYSVRFEQAPEVEKVKSLLEDVFKTATEVKTYGGDNQLKITTTYLISDNSPGVQEQVDAKLNEGLSQLPGKYEIVSQQKVGETVSRDIKSKAIWAILLSCLVMFIYILIRFKKWQYSLGSVAALVHDVAIVLSCYTIFNGVLPFSLEIDQHFIAAILMVMGYSMTDTVVVFDRIREYLSEKNQQDLKDGERHRIINYALNSTLSRTVNTSLTIFFVLLAIFIFGGDVIKGFSFALLIGIVIGTYSSICIATPIVIDFEKKKKE